MRRNAQLVLALTLWWSAVAAIYAAMVAPLARVARPDLAPGPALLVNWLGWLLWVPITLLIIAAVARAPVSRGRVFPAPITALPAIPLAVLAKAVFVFLANGLVPAWYRITPPFADVLIDTAGNSLILAGLVVATAHAVHHARADAAGRLRIAVLEQRLAQARLDALAAQLNPHFLFNALNNIAETLHADPDAADAMIISLSALLRQSLDRSGKHLIPLADEIALMDHYLALQRLRLGDRLQVERAVGEGCDGALVPCLLLQPLAENAIVHGLGQRPSGGCLRLQVAAADGRLQLRLTSDGALQAGPPSGSGIGLANVRERLDSLFGAQAQLTIASIAGNRTEVVISHPLLWAPVA